MTKPTISRKRRRAGFTLLEITLAIVLLMGTALVFVDFTVTDKQRDNARHMRMNAEHIALNEIERLRATVPFSLSGTATTYLNRFGEPLTKSGSNYCKGFTCYSEGQVLRYTRTHATRCDGGQIIKDNTADPLNNRGCTAGKPTVEYTITIVYPTQTNTTGMDSIQHTTTVTPLGEFVAY